MNNPFARLPEVPSFTVTSATLTGGQLSGANVSPQLSWSGAPRARRATP